MEATTSETNPPPTCSPKKSKSFAAGKNYQTRVCENINKMECNGERFTASEVEGAKAGPDITLKSHSNIGIETKNKGAFEGGCKKMTYNDTEKRLEIPEDSIHKAILGDTIIYDGLNLPWYEGKKSKEEWDKVASVIKDFYIPANNDAISKYYREGGVAYIQIENKGLYHTGEDPLNLGVPYFSCEETKLRIRSTKHKKNGICTDVTAALQYNKRRLVKSLFSLDGILPSSMKKVVE